MVQHGLGHFEAYSETLHSGRERAAKVVQTPGGEGDRFGFLGCKGGTPGLLPTGGEETWRVARSPSA